MRIQADEFLRAWPATWIAKRAGEFSVHNVHVLDVPAAPERVFEALRDPRNISPGWHWRALFGFRWLLGKIFGWDKGLRLHGAEVLAPGNHYTFFRIEHVAAPGARTEPPYELGLEVENHLTRAVVSFVIAPHERGSRVFNVTCALFKGRFGNFYWWVIQPFHDGITGSMLRALRRRAQRMPT